METVNKPKDYPVSTGQGSAGSGQGNLIGNVNKLKEKKCGYKKTNFTPAKSGGSHGSSKGDMTY